MLSRWREGEPDRARSRIRQDRGLSVFTALVMVAFVVLVYVVVVIVGGTLLLGRVTPSFWLSVLATAIVALAFEPVRLRVKASLSRALHQDRTSPYQVLARFPATVTGSYPAEELPGRMARVLAEGTGTDRAEVWLAVNNRLELAANWPAWTDDIAGDHGRLGMRRHARCRRSSAWTGRAPPTS